MRGTPKGAWVPAALVFVAAAALSEIAAGQQAGGNRVEGWSRIDELIAQAIASKLTPGAVVVVGQGDQTLYEKAFGFRATVPAEEPMTLDGLRSRFVDWSWARPRP